MRAREEPCLYVRILVGVYYRLVQSGATGRRPNTLFTLPL